MIVVAAILATANASAQQANGSLVEGKTVTVKGQGIYCGEVDLQVTQGSDGTNYLYDSERKVNVLIGATLPSLDSLVAKGQFYDYIPRNENYDDVEKYIRGLIGKSTDVQGTDLSRYLQLAETASSKGDFYAYQMKSVTITQMTYDGKDYTPSASAPVSLMRIAVFHNKNPWALCFEAGAQDVAESPFVMGGEGNSFRRHSIPQEGAVLKINAERGSAGGSHGGSSDVASFVIPFVPNESGVTEIDTAGLKATITYERAGSMLVDAYVTMVNTYDFYKNKFGHKSYDGNGEPINILTYLPGAEMGGYTEYESAMPSFLFTTAQAMAFASSDYYPFVVVCGTGGHNLENGNIIEMHPMTEPSVLCHEFTHLVTKSTAMLSSINNHESAALNESFSDVMAISMMKTSDYGYGPETPWLVGGNGMLTGISNLRNISDPAQSMDGLNPQPDTYKGKHWAEKKYIMMGVQNKFYYLLCEGGKGTNDNGTDYDVPGIGIEKGSQIAYLTLTKYCSPESDYSNICESWMNAAEELYGQNSAEAQSVAKAWSAVGIDSSKSTGINVIVSTPADHWYTLDGRQLSGRPSCKGVYIHNGKKVISSKNHLRSRIIF